MTQPAKLAFVFPGQGSQSVGMGKDIFETTNVGKNFFSKADEILGFPLSALCFEGPAEDLQQTINTQPALYVCGVIACEYLREKGLSPSLVAGHSLGEYAALYAAGVFDFQTGLRLVRKRGELMQQAGDVAPGSMAAIIGLDFDTINEICTTVSESTGKPVCPANFNSPKQLVISGDAGAVEAAMEKAKEQKARRVIPLKVSGAFHSPLMAPVADEFGKFLEQSEFNDATIEFINNADAELLKDAAAIKDSLVRQLTSCVRWSDSMQKAVSMGYSTFLESGPGKVLTGLLRQVDSSVQCHPAGTIEAIEGVITSFSEGE
jgi:[acyl-carrier-protein] S-malonyltransferase